MDRNDQEYLVLLRKHLETAKYELNELRRAMDLKMIEIEQVEELIDALNKYDKESN